MHTLSRHRESLPYPQVPIYASYAISGTFIASIYAAIVPRS